MSELLTPGKEKEIQRITAQAQELQDEINSKGIRDPEELQAEFSEAAQTLNVQVAASYGGVGVELSGSYWAPYIEGGHTRIDKAGLMRGYAYGISAGFETRIEDEEMSWLDEGATLLRGEIGHAVFMGVTRVRSWVGNQVTDNRLFGPVSTSSLRRTQDINQQKHSAFAQAMNFESPEAMRLGEILIDAAQDERLSKLGAFFGDLALRHGTYHPTVNTYLGYVTHGLDLIHQKVQVIATKAYELDSDTPYTPMDCELLEGRANGLCFAPAALLDTRHPAGDEEVALYLSMAVDTDTSIDNVLVLATDITSYGFVCYSDLIAV